MTLVPHQWTTLSNAMLGCAVRRLSIRRVDFSALDKDMFLIAVGCHGLQSLDVQDNVVHSDFVTDGLIRSCVANGLGQLCIYDNDNDSPHTIVSVLDFFFLADTAACGSTRSLKLEGFGITHVFLTKFLEVSTLLFIVEILIFG